MPRPQKESAHWDFAFNTEEDHRAGRGRFHEFCVDSQPEQIKWLEALPPPVASDVKGYVWKRRFGAKKLGDGFDLRFCVYDVLSGYFTYYESEKEAMMDMKPRGRVRVVSAILRPTRAHPHMFSFYTDDGKDYQLYVDSDEKLKMWMTAMPIWSDAELGSNTDKITTALREELESLKRQVDVGGDNVLKRAQLSKEQATSRNGPVLARASRLSNVDSLRLKRELDTLRAENRRLRMEGGAGGALGEDEEAQIIKTYETALGQMFDMRREGEFHRGTFDRYNEALVMLPDEVVTEMYKSFMLLYVEEADEETLNRLGLEAGQVRVVPPPWRPPPRAPPPRAHRHARARIRLRRSTRRCSASRR